MSTSRKRFLIIWFVVTILTAAALMLYTIRELWAWAILISAGLGLLTSFVLTSNIPRIIKTFYVAGYVFAIGVGTFSSFPPVTIPISGAYMGLAAVIIGVAARRWLKARWLAIVMIVGGAIAGIVYNLLFGDYMFRSPLGWGLKTPYCVAIGALAAYVGYQMLAMPRARPASTEPAANTAIAAAPATISGATATALVLGILSVTICAGMAAALGISNLVQSGLFADWVSLGTPAVTVNRIARAAYDYILVQAPNDTYYQLSIRYGDQNQTWIPIQDADTSSRGACLPPESAQQTLSEKYSLLTEPAGVIVDRCIFPYYTPESSGVYAYVLNQQGEVLQWQSPEAFYALGQALKWGLLGGIVIGLLLAAVIAGRRNQPKQG